jgi:hypothetical protein
LDELGPDLLDRFAHGVVVRLAADGPLDLVGAVGRPAQHPAKEGGRGVQQAAGHSSMLGLNEDM